MGTGDYICVTLRGGAPWGFTLREGEGDTYRPFLVSQVSINVRVCVLGVVLTRDKTAELKIYVSRILCRALTDFQLWF